MLKKTYNLVFAIGLLFAGCNDAGLEGVNGSGSKSNSSPAKTDAAATNKQGLEPGNTSTKTADDRGYTLSEGGKKLTEDDAAKVCRLPKSEKVDVYNVVGAGSITKYSLTKPTVIHVTGASANLSAEAVGSDQEKAVDAVCINVTGAAGTVNYLSSVDTNNLFINTIGAGSIIEISVPKDVKVGRVFINAVGSSTQVKLVGDGDYHCADFTVIGAASSVSCAK